ncbi:hypothetical protein FACS189465_0510 [Clostridia bacterium]|nr:hypothetical protein FACS189465_0510 [Clostridia bacterium]
MTHSDFAKLKKSVNTHGLNPVLDILKKFDEGKVLTDEKPKEINEIIQNLMNEKNDKKKVIQEFKNMVDALPVKNPYNYKFEIDYEKFFKGKKNENFFKDKKIFKEFVGRKTLRCIGNSIDISGKNKGATNSQEEDKNFTKFKKVALAVIKVAIQNIDKIVDKKPSLIKRLALKIASIFTKEDLKDITKHIEKLKQNYENLEKICNNYLDACKELYGTNEFELAKDKKTFTRIAGVNEIMGRIRSSLDAFGNVFSANSLQTTGDYIIALEVPSATRLDPKKYTTKNIEKYEKFNHNQVVKEKEAEAEAQRQKVLEEEQKQKEEELKRLEAEKKKIEQAAEAQRKKEQEEELKRKNEEEKELKRLEAEKKKREQEAEAQRKKEQEEEKRRQKEAEAKKKKELEEEQERKMEVERKIFKESLKDYYIFDWNAYGDEEEKNWVYRNVYKRPDKPVGYVPPDKKLFIRGAVSCYDIIVEKKKPEDIKQYKYAGGNLTKGYPFYKIIRKSDQKPVLEFNGFYKLGNHHESGIIDYLNQCCQKAKWIDNGVTILDSTINAKPQERITRRTDTLDHLAAQAR